MNDICECEEPQVKLETITTRSFHQNGIDVIDTCSEEQVCDKCGGYVIANNDSDEEEDDLTNRRYDIYFL